MQARIIFSVYLTATIFQTGLSNRVYPDLLAMSLMFTLLSFLFGVYESWLASWERNGLQ